LDCELRMGVVEPCSLKLSDFMENSINVLAGRLNTIFEYESTMRDFVNVIGDIDFSRIEHKHGEQFIQAYLDGGKRPVTVGKKV
jgi:hypothetical protein